MRVTVRIISVLLILAILAACAAPVAAPTGAPAAGGEKTVLRALFMQQAGYQQSDIEAITQEFETQNPDVDIQLDFVAYEALHDKIITSAASGAGG